MRESTHFPGRIPVRIGLHGDVLNTERGARTAIEKVGTRASFFVINRKDRSILNSTFSERFGKDWLTEFHPCEPPGSTRGLTESGNSGEA